MKKFSRPFGFVGSWLRNAPLKQLWFFFPSFWRTKTAFIIRCKRLCHLHYHTSYNKQQQNSHIFIIFKIHILSCVIKAPKQYPLITKEVWIVLEAISKTCASCLTGVSRHIETMRALAYRLLLSSVSRCLETANQTIALVFDTLLLYIDDILYLCKFLQWI